MADKQVQIRKGNTAENDAFTGAIGELSFDTQQNRLRAHDGATLGGFPHALLSELAVKINRTGDTMSGDLDIDTGIHLDIDGSATFGTGTLSITTLGEILLPDGDSGDPSLSFLADNDTGIFRYGANQLAITTGGGAEPRVIFQESGLWLGDRDIRWSFGGFASDPDTILFRDNSLGIRQTIAGFSTAAQLHLYNQNWVDTLNYERINLEWNGNEAFLSMERQGSGSFRNLSLGSEGASTVSLRTNATNWYTLSTAGLFVGTKSAIGTTATDNLQLLNATAAAAGAQQFSPALRLTGQGWKTNATAGSQAVDWRVYNVPVQGAANPSSNLMFDFSVNGGAFANRLVLASDGTISFVDDVRQTFNPGANNAGLNVGSLAGDPASPSNGDLWYDSASNELTARINGANVTLLSPPFSDALTIIRGSADATKLLRFEIDGFTAGATRVLTPPNANATIAGLEVLNVFTVNQSINAVILLNADGSASFSSGVLTFSTAGLISFPDNVRQIFNPGANNAGINVGALAGDPSAPVNGDLWYDSTANELTARINGANVALGAGGGGSPPFDDGTAIIKGSADATKLLRIEVDGFTTATTRVLTPPNADATIAGLEVAQTFTVLQTIAGNSIGATPTDRLTLSNTTAAAAGAQQFSPALRFTGQGWKTNATAASQATDWRIYQAPVQGAAEPTSELRFEFSVNGGAFDNVLTLTSLGIFTLDGYVFALGLTANGDLTVANDATIGGNLGIGNALSITDAPAINGCGGALCVAGTLNLEGGVFQIGGSTCLSGQGAAVADATGAGDVVAQLNALLASLRAIEVIET